MAAHQKRQVGLDRLAAIILIGSTAGVAPMSGQRLLTKNPAAVSDSFLSVVDARLLPSGGVVVASGRPAVVRFFDRSGRLTARVDSLTIPAWRGQPEFIGVGPGRVTVFDAGDGHTVDVTSTGRQVASTPGSPEAAEGGRLFLTNRTVARGATLTSGCARQVVNGLDPAEPGEVRLAVEDGEGRVWVTRLGGTVVSVHAVGGKQLGTFDLPAGSEVLDAIGTEVLVGVRVNQHLRLRVITLPVKPSSAKVATCPTSADVGIERMTELGLRRALRQAMMEADRVNTLSGVYPSTASTAAGVQLIVLRSGALGWVAAGISTPSSAFCVAAMGYLTPIGWLDGGTRCGQ